MSGGWDEEINWENLTTQQRIERSERLQREDRQRRRELRGVLEIPFMDNQIAVANFGKLADTPNEDLDDIYRPDNKLLWFCHHCGSNGYKYNEVRELFKCYYCHSRNVTVCRAGEASMAIRGLIQNPGVIMSDVYTRRRERLRQRRRNASISSEHTEASIGSPF